MWWSYQMPWHPYRETPPIEVMAKRRSMIARPVQRAYLHFRSSTNHLGNMNNCLVVWINTIQNHHQCQNSYVLEACKRINPCKSWADTTTYQPRNDVSIHFELDQCAMLSKDARKERQETVRFRYMIKRPWIHCQPHCRMTQVPIMTGRKYTLSKKVVPAKCFLEHGFGFGIRISRGFFQGLCHLCTCILCCRDSTVPLHKKRVRLDEVELLPFLSWLGEPHNWKISQNPSLWWYLKFGIGDVSDIKRY